MAGYESGPSIDNLNPVLRQIALQIVAESGGRVWIGSGWRSTAHQTQLYNAWRNGTYDVPVVARPGTSRHEHGEAIDFGGDLRLAQQLARKYGLVFPIEGEPWHGQLGEGVGSAGQQALGDMTQYNLNYSEEMDPVSPDQILANRLHTINRIIGLDPLGGGPGTGVVMEPELMDPMADFAAVNEPTRPVEWGPRYDEAMDVEGQGGMRSVPVHTLEPDAQGTGVQYGVGDAAEYQRYAQQKLKDFGWGEEELAPLIWLWNRESGDPKNRSYATWNPLAQNPHSTAFGIPQFLNGTWAGTGIPKTSNPYRQIDAGLMYIKARHKSPSQALNFHLRNNWY